MPLNDKQILDLVRQKRLLRLDGPDGEPAPLESALHFCKPIRVTEDGKPCLSYGISSYGYDARLGTNFTVLRAASFKDASLPIDPLNMDASRYESFEAHERFIMAPHSYLLGHTVEVFDMPLDTVAICLGKSTYARPGIVVNVTPIEPGFIGQVVVEIANTSDLPVWIYPNQGIAQFMFFKGEPPATDYASRAGKYQHQRGVTLSRK